MVLDFFEEFTKLYWKCYLFWSNWSTFWRFSQYSSQTLNFIDRPTSRIEVRKNIYGSIQAKIKVTDEFESLSPHFGDISPLDPPSIDYGDLSILNFTSSVDRKRINQVRMNKGATITSSSHHFQTYASCL